MKEEGDRTRGEWAAFKLAHTRGGEITNLRCYKFLKKGK